MAKFETETQYKLTVEEAITRLKEIQAGFKIAAVNLHEKIELFSTEHQFQDGLENLKRDVETRASDLETEVKRLRNDLKTIKELLGANLEKKNPLDSRH
jgi:Skp family chaperone for outer membrane proteins